MLGLVRNIFGCKYSYSSRSESCVSHGKQETRSSSTMILFTHKVITILQYFKQIFQQTIPTGSCMNSVPAKHTATNDITLREEVWRAYQNRGTFTEFLEREDIEEFQYVQKVFREITCKFYWHLTVSPAWRAVSQLKTLKVCMQLVQ